MMTPEQIKETVEFYYNIQKPVHITKRDGGYYRGLIVKPFNGDKMVLKEELYGEIMIWIDRVADVQLRVPKRGNNNGANV